MTNDRLDTLKNQFRELFGNPGGDLDLGNVERSHTTLSVCQKLMGIDGPVLYDYFEEWDRQPNERKPFAVEQALVRLGQWEGAWALAQLHYDQLLKMEASKRVRLHKGHPLCNLALAGQAIGSPTLTRHYAMLSSAGDVYWERNQPALKDGGLAPTLVERSESRDQHYVWRDKVRNRLEPYRNEPVYLESFLASRWFGAQYAEHIMDLATVEGRHGCPFAEVLLDSVENRDATQATVTGTRFEAAVGLILSSTPGFGVDSARRTTDEQVDLVVRYTPEPLIPIGLEPGLGLVECKSSGKPVTSPELRDFGAKCLFHRVKFGILVARVGTSGCLDRFENPQHAELVRRRFQMDGLTILVLTMMQLRERCQDLRGVLDGLGSDYKDLVFGPVA